MLYLLMIKLILSILGFFIVIPQSQFLSGTLAPARSSEVADQNVLEWVKNDKRRMLHVVYSVGDLDKTIKYVSLVPLFDAKIVLS